MVSIELINSDDDSYWPLGTSFTQAMRRLSIAGDPSAPDANQQPELS
jgi:hypothetical protein